MQYTVTALLQYEITGVCVLQIYRRETSKKRYRQPIFCRFWLITNHRCRAGENTIWDLTLLFIIRYTFPATDCSARGMCQNGVAAWERGNTFIPFAKQVCVCSKLLFLFGCFQDRRPPTNPKRGNDVASSYAANAGQIFNPGLLAKRKE